jgi:CheY-like chemotaxis protein
MAHVLVADEWPRDKLFRFLLEEEGHTVTVVTNGWDMLMTMRATLHPLVVVYSDFMLLYGPFAETEEEFHAQERLWQMCERYIDDLRQHRFIETTGSCGPIPAETQYLHEQLGIVRVHLPFDLDEILARINEAAAQLEPAP